MLGPKGLSTQMERVRGDLLSVKQLFERDRRTASLDYQRKQLQIKDSKEKLARANRDQDEHKKKEKDLMGKVDNLEEEIDKIDNEINLLKDEINDINEQMFKIDNHKTTIDHERRRVDINLQEFYAVMKSEELKI